MITIDLNCDLGEGFLYDEQLMPLISSANIACGFHAGGPDLMKRTVELALQHNVAIGAHPGFNDKASFGRKEQYLLPHECYRLIIEQLEVLAKITSVYSVHLHHIKPHGALYNMAAKDKELAAVIARAVKDFDARLILYGLSGSHSITEAERVGLSTASEVFADRTYGKHGTLTPRSFKNALIKDETAAIKQVLQMLQAGTVTSIDGTLIPITAQTICIHGDGHHAVAFASLIKRSLHESGITIRSV